MPENRGFLDLVEKRRNEDGLDSIPQGFTRKMHGISGYVYFKEENKILEIYVEWSGVNNYHFLTWREGFNNWIYPEKEKVTEEDKKGVKPCIVIGLRKINIKQISNYGITATQKNTRINRLH